MIPCSWKESFGVECLTCGAQRSFLDLVSGEMYNSMAAFPALIPLLILGLLLPVHLVFKLKYGARLILVFFVISVVLILGNYVVKLVNGAVLG